MMFLARTLAQSTRAKIEHSFPPLALVPNLCALIIHFFIHTTRIIFFLAVISTPAHMDSGFLTLLQTFDYQGLEIEVDGVWYSVPPVENALVVNLGEQMTAMSNGRFKATIHRVIDIGVDRLVACETFILISFLKFCVFHMSTVFSTVLEVQIMQS